MRVLHATLVLLLLGTGSAEARGRLRPGGDDYLYQSYEDALDATDVCDDDGDYLYQSYEDALGTDVTVADTDGDGWEDWYEYVYGTDALDPLEF